LQAAETSPVPQEVRWHPVTRVGFRFFFIFFILYMFPEPFRFLSQDWFSKDWMSVVAPGLMPWMASLVLHIEMPRVPYASNNGDTFFNLARLLVVLLISAGGAAVWSVAARRSANHAALHSWLRLYARVVLGSGLLSYGSSKLFFPGQFKDPALSTLLVPFGELPPNSVLWLFMGTSHWYTQFSALVETVAGVLVLLPRLNTVGALVGAVAMANVFVLDACYDVAVKMYSLFLFMAGLFLVAPYLKGLAMLLVSNPVVVGRSERPLFRNNRLQRDVTVLLVVFCCYLLGPRIVEGWRAAARVRGIPGRTPYYGVWAVDTFVSDGIAHAPLLTDDVRWKLVVFDWESYQEKPCVVIHFAPGGRKLYTMDFSRERKEIDLLEWNLDQRGTLPSSQPSPAAPAVAHLKADETGTGALLLEGDFQGRKVRAVLHRATPAATVRPDQRFRWVPTGPRWGDDIIM
jgi:uncharacterized membrane protein YphA (DoxX/SURF4 family)